jgi:hypothetical protein
MFIQIQIQGRVSSIHWQNKSSLVLAKGGVRYVGITTMFDFQQHCLASGGTPGVRALPADESR